MKKIPLFGESLSAYSQAVSAQRRLNVFYDVRKDQDKNTAIIRGTPGSVLSAVLPTSPIRGWRVVGSLAYAVAGAVLYSVTTNNTITSLGTLSTSLGYVTLSDNGVQLGIVDGASLYVYTLTTGSYFQAALNAAGSFGVVTDANFPAGATSLCFLDGRNIANRTLSRQAYVCEQYDMTHWTSVSSIPTYFTKENSSDQLVAIDVWNGAIILWGQQSIEFWQDVGSSPLPFARVNGSSQTWGLAAINSRIALNNTMVFLGQNPQGGIQVLMFNGYAPQRISTSDVENKISGFTTWQDAVALAYIVDGHPMYQLSFPTANQSFLFDALTNLWFETQTGLAVQARHFGNLGITFNTHNYISDVSSSNIYRLDTTAYTDNGTAIKRQCVSRHINMDGNQFGIDELLLDMETGIGLQSGQGVNPQLVLEVSKDGGRTFGNERWSSIGLVGQYLARVIFRRLGMGRDFVFRFTMTDPVKFTILKGSVTTRHQEGAGG